MYGRLKNGQEGCDEGGVVQAGEHKVSPGTGTPHETGGEMPHQVPSSSRLLRAT
jgi:hypothetical protein